MPLIKSGSKDAISKNIRKEMQAGKSHSQSVAIALAAAAAANKTRKKKK